MLPLRFGKHGLTLHPEKTRLIEFKRPRRDNPLRGGDLSRGTTNIAAAWFSGPTNRYRHSPFGIGADQHPTLLTVSTTGSRVMRFELPKDSVFEDRTPT